VVCTVVASRGFHNHLQFSYASFTFHVILRSYNAFLVHPSPFLGFGQARDCLIFVSIESQLARSNENALADI